VDINWVNEDKARKTGDKKTEVRRPWNKIKAEEDHLLRWILLRSPG